MRTSQRKALLTLVLATLVVVFLSVLLTKNSTIDPLNSLDPISREKAQILSLASSNEGLTSQDRSLIFQTLSGPKILQYHFTPEEKLKIIEVLNR